VNRALAVLAAGAFLTLLVDVLGSGEPALVLAFGAVCSSRSCTR
jgi:hypothetical protein